MVWAPALSELQRACRLARHHTLKLHSMGTAVLGMPQPGVPMPAAALCSVFNPPHISGRSAVGSTSSLCAQRTAGAEPPWWDPAGRSWLSEHHHQTPQVCPDHPVLTWDLRRKQEKGQFPSQTCFLWQFWANKHGKEAVLQMESVVKSCL